MLRSIWNESPRARVLAAALLMAAVTLAALSASCAGALPAAKQSVAAAERAGASSLRAFGEYDASHQLAIAEGARARGDAAGGAAELAAYRRSREPVLLAGASFDAAAAASRAGIAAAEASRARALPATLLDRLKEFAASASALAAEVRGFVRGGRK